ncbi:MAG: ABC transporter substrate-binding protein [Alkalispirochaetaceae bacterium]
MKTTRLMLLMLVLSAALAFAGGQQEPAPQPEPTEPEQEEEREITLWTTEEQPERMEVQENIAAAFEAETGIAVEVVPVTENEMGQRVTAAFSAGELPDIIYHPLNFTLSWADAGILDATAATDVIESLGEETYGAGVLSLVETGGDYAAVPVDGWTQLLVYRADLFEDEGLDPPTDYESIRAAIDALHDPPDMHGFVAATDPSQVYMMQVFEHIALANGVDVVDDEGNVTLDTEAMRETLEFYKELADASPSGNLYWQQSRELFFAGEAAMIVWSPFVLDELAGLRDDAPVTFTDDPTSAELARRTGFATRLAGPSNPDGSGWTDVRYFGITVDADVAAAQQFVEYSMNEGYIDTLEIAPEGKFPVRRGTESEPDRFLEEWSELEVGVERKMPLSEIYSEEVIESLVEGLETGSRWGFDKGYGGLTSQLYDTRVIAEIVREYIDGDISVDEALSEMQSGVESLQD